MVGRVASTGGESQVVVLLNVHVLNIITGKANVKRSVERSVKVI